MVRDSTGAVVPQARVTARNVLTSFARTAATDTTGNYLITNLPVGQYAITVEKEGFHRHIQEGITLVVNQNARVDVALAIGSVSESISVNAQPFDVDTRSATTGEMVDRTRIQELPLNGRNAMALARVVPGVISVSAPTVVTNGREGPQCNCIGRTELHRTSSAWMEPFIRLCSITSGLNLPSPDALQEFRIVTSGADAEYGRHGGGLFIAVTRAGTNQFQDGVGLLAQQGLECPELFRR